MTAAVRRVHVGNEQFTQASSHREPIGLSLCPGTAPDSARCRLVGPLGIGIASILPLHFASADLEAGAQGLNGFDENEAWSLRNFWRFFVLKATGSERRNIGIDHAKDFVRHRASMNRRTLYGSSPGVIAAMSLGALPTLCAACPARISPGREVGT